MARFDANDCSSGLWNKGVGSAGAKAPSANGAGALSVTLEAVSGSLATALVAGSPSCPWGSSGWSLFVLRRGVGGGTICARG